MVNIVYIICELLLVLPSFIHYFQSTEAGSGRAEPLREDIYSSTGLLCQRLHAAVDYLCGWVVLNTFSRSMTSGGNPTMTAISSPRWRWSLHRSDLGLLASKADSGIYEYTLVNLKLGLWTKGSKWSDLQVIKPLCNGYIIDMHRLNNDLRTMASKT